MAGPAVVRAPPALFGPAGSDPKEVGTLAFDIDTGCRRSELRMPEPGPWCGARRRRAVAPDRGVKVFEPIGTRFAAVSGSSSGKVLLAWLPDDRLADVLPRASWRTVSDERSYTRQTYRALLARVREDGYADNDGETDPDLWSISVPVRHHTDGVVAALTFPTLRTRGPQRRAELTAVALKFAAEASTALHFA